MTRNRITNIEKLLDRIESKVAKNNDISIGAVLEAVGRRSFGPILLLAGLVMAAPGVGDIPGVPTIIGGFVLLAAGQMLVGRSYLWMPRWLLKRTVRGRSICKAIGWLRGPAGYVDRVLKPRLEFLTNNAGAYAIAIVCAAIAVTTPLMEVVLFAANFAGVALAAFGLAMVAHDGLVALFAFAVSLGTVGAFAYYFL